VPEVSFDIFFQRFENGEAAPADRGAVRTVLGPLIEEHGDGWARIRTSDGEADVYGIDNPASGSLMINRASGREVWAIMFGLGRAADFAVMPVGCGTFVFSDDAVSDLPDGAPQPITIVTSVEDLVRAVEAS
jgi:hypothetical protein